MASSSPLALASDILAIAAAATIITAAAAASLNPLAPFRTPLGDNDSDDSLLQPESDDLCPNSLPVASDDKAVSVTTTEVLPTPPEAVDIREEEFFAVGARAA